jgi:hypothetical protein
LSRGFVASKENAPSMIPENEGSDGSGGARYDRCL